MERANEFNSKYQKTIESSTSADNFGANKKVIVVKFYALKTRVKVFA